MCFFIRKGITMIDIGTLVNFHGVRGEVKILSSSDFTNERFAVGKTVTINNETYTITRYRKHKNFHMLTFDGVTNLNDVEHLKGHTVYQALDAIDIELPEGQYHYEDIIGCEVINLDNNETLGEVTSIIPTGSKDVFVVSDKYMIPNVDDFIKLIDIERKRIEIEPIEGLLDL